MDIFQIIVLAVGIVIAATGLLMILFRKVEGPSKYKILGQELEIPSQAFGIFLVGCVMFALPFTRFWPEQRDQKKSATNNELSEMQEKLRMAEKQARDLKGQIDLLTSQAKEREIESQKQRPTVGNEKSGRTTMEPVSTAQQADKAQSSPSAPWVVLKEKEPNNDVSQANTIALGTTIRGEITEKDRDFFAIKTSNKPTGNIRVILRKRFWGEVTVYNAAERKVQAAMTR